MPMSAAPYCTYVGTSVARTMITRTPGLRVATMSLRVFSGSSARARPVAASSGADSSKMRPLESARVIMASGDPFDAGPEGAQARLEPLVAAVQVVDTVDDGLALGHEAGDHEACRGA